MNISIGITEQDSKKDIEKLAHSGADEFYCGIIPESWSKEYGYQISLNRREWPVCQYKSFKILENHIKKVHTLNKKIFVTFNAHYYIPFHYKYIIEYLNKLNELNIDAMIVSDLGLLLTIKNMDLDFEICISGEAGIYNQETIDFFSFGIQKIILPRHLSIEEIEKLITHTKNSGIQSEVFIMGERCPFDSDSCTVSHGWNKSRFCYSEYDKLIRKRKVDKYLNKKTDNENRNIKIPVSEIIKWEQNKALYNLWSKPERKFGVIPCGICLIKKFEDFGVDSIKIVSRGKSLKKRLNMLELVTKAFTKDNSEFLKQKEKCKLGYFCYYR